MWVFYHVMFTIPQEKHNFVLDGMLPPFPGSHGWFYVDHPSKPANLQVVIDVFLILPGFLGGDFARVDHTKKTEHCPFLLWLRNPAPVGNR